MRLGAKRDVPPCSLPEHLRISLLPQFSTFFDGHNRPVWRVSTSFGSTEFSPMKCRLARGVGRFHFCYFFITRSEERRVGKECIFGWLVFICIMISLYEIVRPL